MAKHGLVFGPIENCLHLCVDMQRLFGPGGPWTVPWAQKVLPAIEELCASHADKTLFTRFIPASRPGKGPGSWSRYYRRWADVTLVNIDRNLLELMPSLARYTPPAKILDKRVYSPWTEGRLDTLLSGSDIDTPRDHRRRNRRVRPCHGTRRRGSRLPGHSYNRRDLQFCRRDA